MGFIEEARQLVQDIIVPELRGIKASIDRHDTRFEELANKLEKMDKKIDYLVQQAETRAIIVQFEDRLKSLEQRVGMG